MPEENTAAPPTFRVELSVVCELCERATPDLTVHHLVPKQVGRRKGAKVADLPTARLCRPCHRQLHALFTNAELAKRLSDLNELKRQESVQRWLGWIRRQPVEQGVRIRR